MGKTAWPRAKADLTTISRHAAGRFPRLPWGRFRITVTKGICQKEREKHTVRPIFGAGQACRPRQHSAFRKMRSARRPHQQRLALFFLQAPDRAVAVPPGDAAKLPGAAISIGFLPQIGRFVELVEFVIIEDRFRHARQPLGQQIRFGDAYRRRFRNSDILLVKMLGHP